MCTGSQIITSGNSVSFGDAPICGALRNWIEPSVYILRPVGNRVGKDSHKRRSAVRMQCLIDVVFVCIREQSHKNLRQDVKKTQYGFPCEN